MFSYLFTYRLRDLANLKHYYTACFIGTIIHCYRVTTFEINVESRIGWIFGKLYIQIIKWFLYSSPLVIETISFIMRSLALQNKLLKSDSHLPKKLFYENFSKMMKNALYFNLKALFVLKIFKFFSWTFGHVEKTAWLER